MPEDNFDAMKTELRGAFDRMIENIYAARDAIDNPELFPVPASERNLAEGYRYVLGFLLAAIERSLADPLYPRFRRAIQPMNRSTIDNSDAVYLATEIDGNHSYVVRGKALDSRHWRGQPPLDGPRAPQYVIFELASGYAGDSGSLRRCAPGRASTPAPWTAMNCRWKKTAASRYSSHRRNRAATPETSCSAGARARGRSTSGAT